MTESVLSGSFGQDNILVAAKLLLQPGDHSWVEGQEDGYTHLWKTKLEQVRSQKNKKNCLKLIKPALPPPGQGQRTSFLRPSTRDSGT